MKSYLIGGLILIVLVVGSVTMLRGGRPPNGGTEIDLTATSIPGAGPMPKYLLAADPLIKKEYLWAADHLEELQYIPCYCGCFLEDGHTDNFSCYFDRDQKGQITGYDLMSLS